MGSHILSLVVPCDPLHPFGLSHIVRGVTVGHLILALSQRVCFIGGGNAGHILNHYAVARHQSAFEEEFQQLFISALLQGLDVLRI